MSQKSIDINDYKEFLYDQSKERCIQKTINYESVEVKRLALAMLNKTAGIENRLSLMEASIDDIIDTVNAICEEL